MGTVSSTIEHRNFYRLGMNFSKSEVCKGMTAPNAEGQKINFKNVLLATDFSPCAGAAFPYALALAKRSQGIMYLVHVTTPDMYGYAPEEPARSLFEQIRAHAREQMAKFTSKQDFEGVPFQTLFGEGEVWETIEGIIANHHVDLIVLSTHGRRGVKKLIMGSVAEEIVRLATVPVLTVGPHCQPSADRLFHKILYPTDFSTASLKARDAALSLAASFQAGIAILHVAPKAVGNPEQRKRDEDVLTGQLRELIRSDRGAVPVGSIGLHVQYGEPGEEILKAASEYQADLIVLSVRDAGALPRIATSFGSIVHRVTSQARCPVLTVRA
jgi:nucleotide-binding universal stress UspA family protein